MALTNSDISDPTVHTRAEDAFYRVAEMLHQRPETPTDTQIVLDIRSDADWYYCLSWTLRRVFWPVQTSVSLTSGSGIDVFDLSHLGELLDDIVEPLRCSDHSDQRVETKRCFGPTSHSFQAVVVRACPSLSWKVC